MRLRAVVLAERQLIGSGPEGEGDTMSHATRVQARRANRQYKKEKSAEGFAQVASMSHRGQTIVFGVLAVIMLSIAGWFFRLPQEGFDAVTAKWLLAPLAPPIRRT